MKRTIKRSKQVLAKEIWETALTVEDLRQLDYDEDQDAWDREYALMVKDNEYWADPPQEDPRGLGEWRWRRCG